MKEKPALMPLPGDLLSPVADNTRTRRDAQGGGEGEEEEEEEKALIPAQINSHKVWQITSLLLLFIGAFLAGVLGLSLRFGTIAIWLAAVTSIAAAAARRQAHEQDQAVPHAHSAHQLLDTSPPPIVDSA